MEGGCKLSRSVKLSGLSRGHLAKAVHSMMMQQIAGVHRLASQVD